LRVEQVLYR